MGAKINKSDSIEKKVADAILERDSVSLTIDGHTYPIAPPTPATIILISELVAEMPVVEISAENILTEVLKTAKDMRIVGDIAAALVLGGARVKEQRMVEKSVVKPCRRFNWRRLRFVPGTKTEYVYVPEVERLAELILDHCEPRTLNDVVTKRLTNAQIGDFFGLTTSLSEANAIKRTREVEATASGD